MIFSIETQVEDYRTLVPVNPDDYDGGNLWINGQKKLSSWKAPQVHWSAQENDNEKTPDIAYLNPGFYAFNEKALSVLRNILEENGELLPLPIKGEQWMAFNPTNEIDCIDSEETEWKIRRSGDKGRILKLVLNESDCKDAAIFQIPETNKNSFYISEDFVNIVTVNQLTGIEFHKLQTK